VLPGNWRRSKQCLLPASKSFRKVRSASEGFYATLDRDQKAARDKLFQRRSHH
jgi:hypothetical protein